MRSRSVLKAHGGSGADGRLVRFAVFYYQVPEQSLRVIVPIVAKPDRVDQMLQLLVSLIAPSSAEEGCISYELLHNLQDPTDFTVIEEWQSETHYGGHLSSPHVQAALRQFAELGAKPLEIRRYERLGE